MRVLVAPPRIGHEGIAAGYGGYTKIWDLFRE